MKKLALLFVAAFSLSCVGLTGCGGSGDSKVIEAPDVDPNAQEMSDAEQAQFDKEMEKAYTAGQGN